MANNLGKRDTYCVQRRNLFHILMSESQSTKSYYLERHLRSCCYLLYRIPAGRLDQRANRVKVTHKSHIKSTSFQVHLQIGTPQKFGKITNTDRNTIKLMSNQLLAWHNTLPMLHCHPTIFRMADTNITYNCSSFHPLHTTHIRTILPTFRSIHTQHSTYMHIVCCFKLVFLPSDWFFICCYCNAKCLTQKTYGSVRVYRIPWAKDLCHN